MSDKEYIAHMSKEQKKERTKNKIGCIILVICSIILLILLQWNNPYSPANIPK